MKLLIVLLDFFSQYGGGQVYGRNLVSMLMDTNQQAYRDAYLGESGIDNLSISVISYDSQHHGDVMQRQYNGLDIYSVDPGIEFNQLLNLISSIAPDEIHSNVVYTDVLKISKELGIKNRITIHSSEAVCPIGLSLNYKDELCLERMSHDKCLRCALHHVRYGDYAYKLLKYVPQNSYIKLGRYLRKLPFIYFVTPMGCVGLNIDNAINRLREIDKYADSIVAPCKALALALENNSVEIDKIRILPHSIPLIKDIAVNNQEKNGPVKFYYLGRIAYVKGLHVLLEAFSSISNNIELHIIGGAERRDEIKYLAKLKEQYGSIRNIFWHGKIDHDMCPRMIADYDVLIHPAICLEAFGLTIAESLALGKYVIATKCGGPEMQITSGVNGTLVAPNDVEELKCAMIDYIEHKT